MDYFVKVDGGIGRCIAATGAVKEYAKKKEEQGDRVFVVSGFPYVFEGVDHVERVYPIQTPFLYEDKIMEGDFLEPEPYNDKRYYKNRKHLSTVFNYLLNGSEEFIKPEMLLTENELSDGKKMIEQVKIDSGKKKVMLIQPWGSQGGEILPPQNPNDKPQVKKDESYRSFTVSFIEKLAEAFKEEYLIFNIRNNGQLDNKDMRGLYHFNPRVIFSMIPHVDAVISCDSFLHHASEAIGGPKTAVLWGGTCQEHLGYEDQLNIKKSGKVFDEPNRIIHNHAWYIQKNSGCNKFGDEEITKLKEYFSKPIELNKTKVLKKVLHE